MLVPQIHMGNVSHRLKGTRDVNALGEQPFQHLVRGKIIILEAHLMGHHLGLGITNQCSKGIRKGLLICIV